MYWVKPLILSPMIINQILYREKFSFTLKSLMKMLIITMTMLMISMLTYPYLQVHLWTPKWCHTMVTMETVESSWVFGCSVKNFSLAKIVLPSVSQPIILLAIIPVDLMVKDYVYKDTQDSSVTSCLQTPHYQWLRPQPWTVYIALKSLKATSPVVS